MASRISLIICIFAVFGVFTHFYWAPTAMRSWVIGVVFLPLPLFMFAGLAVLPKAVDKVSALLAQINEFDLIYFLIYVSFSLGGKRSADELRSSPVDGIRAIRMALLIAIEGWMILTIFIQKQPLADMVGGVQLGMVLYAAISLLSMFWSSFRSLSAWKAFEVFVDISFICYLLSAPRWKENLSRLWRLTWFLIILLMCSAWGGAILRPGSAFRVTSNALLRYQLQGIVPAINPNGLGLMSALIGAISMIRFLSSKDSQSKVMYAGVWCFALITLVFAQCRTAFFSFAAVHLLILILDRRWGLAIAVLVTVALLFVGSSRVADFTYAYVRRGQTEQQFSGMSGRRYYWRVAWKQIKQRPMLGYGFYSGHRFAEDLGLSNLDNTYVEILQNLGILGLIPISFAFIVTWKRVLTFLLGSRHEYGRPGPMAVELFAALFIITVKSIFGVSFNIHSYVLLLFLLILAYGIAHKPIKPLCAYS